MQATDEQLNYVLANVTDAIDSCVRLFEPAHCFYVNVPLMRC